MIWDIAFREDSAGSSAGTSSGRRPRFCTLMLFLLRGTGALFASCESSMTALRIFWEIFRRLFCEHVDGQLAKALGQSFLRNYPNR